MLHGLRVCVAAVIDHDPRFSPSFSLSLRFPSALNRLFVTMKIFSFAILAASASCAGAETLRGIEQKRILQGGGTGNHDNNAAVNAGGGAGSGGASDVGYGTTLVVVEVARVEVELIRP